MVPSRNHPSFPSQETRGEARAHLKQWGRGSSQPAAPAAQAESLLHTPHSCRKGNTNDRSTKGLSTWVTGCVTSTLGACPSLGTCWLQQTPFHTQGLSSDDCQLLHWTRSGMLRPPLPARDRKSGREERQLVEQLLTCMHIMHITKQGAYKTHCWPLLLQPSTGRRETHTNTDASPAGPPAASSLQYPPHF